MTRLYYQNAAAHSRWVAKIVRAAGSPDYRDEWYAQQCHACSGYIRLDGELGEDWGVCANAASAFDGELKFEHDGCDAHTPSEDA